MGAVAMIGAPVAVAAVTFDAFAAFVAFCIAFVAFGVALCGCAAAELVSSRRDLARREAEFLAAHVGCAVCGDAACPEFVQAVRHG